MTISTDADLPGEIETRVLETLEPGSARAAIVDLERAGGGCIHPAARVRTTSGRTAFLKWSARAGETGFEAEAGGLVALSEAEGFRVPRVLSFERGDAHSFGWILLEFIEGGAPHAGTARELGDKLAQLHRPLQGARPGWDTDGYIGSLPQRNRGGDREWPEFWRDLRLEAQWKPAWKLFDREARHLWDRVLAETETALADCKRDGLSLLHGDLWHGNLIVDERGHPVLVDPAVYRGHREVDFAMMELFGGFDPVGLRRYRERVPFAEGYDEIRRDLYQLYPLLVHVNLFGASYVDDVRARLRRLGQALG